MRSRGPISAHERHSYDEEEIGARPAASSNESGDWGEEEGDIGASTEVLVAMSPRAFDFGSHPKGAVPSSPATRAQTGPRRSASCRCP